MPRVKKDKKLSAASVNAGSRKYQLRYFAEGPSLPLEKYWGACIRQWVRLLDSEDAIQRHEASQRLDEVSRILALTVGDQERTKAFLADRNAVRKNRADDEILQEFNAWRFKVKAVVASLPTKEQVRRFKIAKRPYPDRKSRRLTRLLKAGSLD